MGAKTTAALWISLIWFRPAWSQQDLLRDAARLDTEHKCGESEAIYQRLLTRGTPSPALLNNLGNHHLICGDQANARTYFEKLLTANPQSVNANVQLARMETEKHRGARALEYLARVPENEPAIRLLRAEALHWAGKEREALAALDREAAQVKADATLEYLYGVTCARMGAYERAVDAFNDVLMAHPGDPDVLLSLGRAAARAGMWERAVQALEVAIRMRPGETEPLMELAGVNISRKDYARALYLLVQAQKLAPNRAEIALALAHAAESGGYYGDAALAFDRYLALNPNDEAAKRDRALASGLTDARQTEGLKDLRSYLAKHPDDAVAHYDLAQLVWHDDPQTAIAELKTSLRLDPRSAAAHADVGWLLNRQGQTADAVPHFEKALVLHPEDPRAMDQLGAAYLALDRPADAEKLLRKAAALAPQDSEITMHLGRALMETGHEDEGRKYLQKIQSMHRAPPRGAWHQAGLIESAGLPPAERNLHEAERLRREAAQHPDDPELQFRLAGLLLATNAGRDAEGEFRVLLERNIDGQMARRAGEILLQSEHYALAREFLERAAPKEPGARVDLAAAVFFLDGAQQALPVLDSVPEEERTGDYVLLRAKVLDAAGKSAEAVQMIEHAPAGSISNPRIAGEAAELLLRKGRPQSALSLLSEAGKANPDLSLLRVMVLALMKNHAAAEASLKQIESQWPEWDKAYVVHGLLLEAPEPESARLKWQTALALGSQDPIAKCGLERLNSGSAPSRECSCTAQIEQILFHSCPER